MSNSEQTNKPMDESKAFYKMILVFIVLCIVVTIFSFNYYRQLNATIRDESSAYLQEVSRRISENVDRIINDNFAMLGSTAAVLETGPPNDQLRPALRKQQELLSYQSIMLIDRDGKAFDLDNNDIFLSTEANFWSDISSGNKFLSTTQLINNQESILLSVPLNGITVNGRDIIALAATFSPASFEQVLSMNSFDEKAYSQIVYKNGASVTRPSSPYVIRGGYNIFSSLESSTLDKDVTLDSIRSSMSKNESGQIYFSLDGAERYMVYTPIAKEGWYLLTFVPTQVVNERSTKILQATLLICSLVAISFIVLISMMIYVFNASRRKLEKIAYVDNVTGGHTLERFYYVARKTIDSNSGQKYALMYSNMEKFKVLNEQLGRNSCDAILKSFHELISSVLSPDECIGRISADNFCILVKYESEEAFTLWFNELYDKAKDYISAGKFEWSMPVTEFGIYVIDDPSLSIPLMVDRAKLALRGTSINIDNRMRYAYYNDEVRQQLFREMHLEDIMADALKNKEFQVYLQPKYHLPEEQIGGAEALVRWVNPDEGMIYPNEFIDLFERNEFIVDLDLYMFEEVCRIMKDWKEQGFRPIKVSINCSRVHLKNPLFLTPYINIANKYGIDKQLLEIELTESIAMGNEERLSLIIDQIKGAGFCCSIDDFGSGYSSLNLIQTIPVNTLKLDRIFFLNDISDMVRTEAIVRSIVSMAKALNMDTVAEGVELRDHVDMLKKVGCDFIQGYVFAKPMKLKSFEDLAFGREDN